MIHRSMAAALRRQDWVAIAIELLIVVVGLYLGLQLNGWKEERDARVRERAALVRLEQEAEAAVLYFGRFVERFDDINGKQEEAIAALSAGEKAKFSPTELADRLGTLGFYPGIAPPRAVYDELTGSGLMNDIGSDEVRTAIASYYATLGFVQSQLEYFRLGASLEARDTDPGMFTRYDPKAPELRDRFIDTVDFDVVARNPVQMSILVSDFRNQLKFQTYRRTVHEKAEQMCKALADALHRSCAVGHGSPPTPAVAR